MRSGFDSRALDAYTSYLEVYSPKPVHQIALTPEAAEELRRQIRAHSTARVLVTRALHWVLDVVFGEDASQVGVDHGAQNLVVLRHIALNLLKQHPAKLSIKSKRNKAGWDNSFLHQVIFGLDA